MAVHQEELSYSSSRSYPSSNLLSNSNFFSFHSLLTHVSVGIMAGYPTGVGAVGPIQ